MEDYTSLKIVRKLEFAWVYIPNNLMNGFGISKGYFSFEESTNKLQIVEDGRSKRPKVILQNITFEDEFLGEPEITFADFYELQSTLTIKGCPLSIETVTILGATEFTDLTDVPSTYTGQAGKVATVKVTEDGLDFTTISGATNLSYTPSPANGTVNSDTGTDAIIPLVSTNAGLMLPGDKTKLDSIQSGAEVNVNADWNAVSGDAQILNKPIIPTPNTAGQNITLVSNAIDVDIPPIVNISSILGTTGSSPDSIAIDSLGNIYTANRISNNVSKITPQGVSTILGTTGSSPRAIAVDVLGNVYTANTATNNVTKITPQGISTILGTTGNLSSPRGIAVDALGNVYTANSGTNDVSKITPQGVSTILGTTGTSPRGIVLDSLGNVYTSNTLSNNVSKITPQGVSTILGTALGSPEGIAIDSLGNIYTTGQNTNTVTKITPAGAHTTLGTTGNRPYGIIIDSLGNVYTANALSNNISKITPQGVSTILATTGTAPVAITIDILGNIYSSNITSNDVTKITIDNKRILAVDDNLNIVRIETPTSGATNLGYTTSPTNGIVTSDTGTDATIPLADGTNAGLMLPSDKTKLDGIQSGAEVNVNADWNAVSGDALILNKPIIPTQIGVLGANLFSYKIKTTILIGDPTAGHLVYSDATQINSTQINVSNLVEDGFDVRLFLENFKVGDKLIIQDRDDSTNNQVWQITLPLVFDQPTFVKIEGVTLISSEGTGTTNFANNHEVFMVRQAAESSIPTDAVPTDGSTNAVSSNGVFDALALKQDTFFEAIKKGWSFLEHFLGDGNGGAIGNGSGVITGASGAGAICAPNNSTSYPNRTNQQGVLRMATGTTATGTTLFRLGGNTIPTLIFGNGEFIQETWVNIETLSNATDRFYDVYGLAFNTNANPSTAIAFVYDDGGASPQYGFAGTVSPNWKCYTRNSGGLTWTITSIPVVASQWYKLTMIINAAGTSVTYYIDNALVATHTTVPPSGTAIGLHVKTVGTNSRNSWVDYLLLNQNYTTPNI